MFQTPSHRIGSTRFPQLVIVTSILVTVASPTAAQLRLVDLAISDGFLSASLDFAPTFPEQADTEMTSPASPLGTTDLIEVTVQDGDLNSTGARSNARAGFTTITTNAQFFVDGGLPAGFARSTSSIEFDVINATETPHEVFLDFFLPPTLLEFSDNVESAGLAVSDNIEAFASARLCRDECGSTSMGDDLLFEFEATLSELYVPPDIDAARIEYDLLVDVSSSNPQLNLEPLHTPIIVVDPQPGGNTVTVNFTDFFGTVRLFELAPNSSRNFEYEMQASVLGGGVASGIGPVSAIAAINDPVGIGPIVSIRSVPIPEPSPCLLLAMGTVVLGVYRN